MKTLTNRLDDSSLENKVTTAEDYGMLLALLSNKLNKPVDELRAGRGSKTYKEWATELNN